jgi:hypothetical protein
VKVAWALCSWRTGKKDKADAWRKKLQEAKDAAKNPTKP